MLNFREIIEKVEKIQRNGKISIPLLFVEINLECASKDEMYEILIELSHIKETCCADTTIHLEELLF